MEDRQVSQGHQVVFMEHLKLVTRDDTPNTRSVSDEDRLTVAIHGCNTAPTPTGFTEIVSDDFPILHAPSWMALQPYLVQMLFVGRHIALKYFREHTLANPRRCKCRVWTFTLALLVSFQH